MNSTSGYMKVNALASSSIYGLEDAKCGNHLDVFSRKKNNSKENISLRILGFPAFLRAKFYACYVFWVGNLNIKI
jgi:hypothetical protein